MTDARGALPPPVIRDEKPSDLEAIEAVTIAAFKTLPLSGHTEQFIIRALRAAGALSVSLVAEREGRVVGHIAFSLVTIDDGSPRWYGLGPVSVLPSLHRQGVGTALINEGLARIRRLGARGCVLVGHPEYYKRFGFHNIPGLVYEGIPQEYFVALPFAEPVPQGRVIFHQAFLAAG